MHSVKERANKEARIELRLELNLLSRVDHAQGIASRSAWIRQAMEEKIERESGRIPS